jgi:hypothetical protein
MPYLHYIDHQPCPNCRAITTFSLLHAAMVTELSNIAPNTQGWQQVNNRWRGIFCCSNCRSALFASFNSHLLEPQLNRLQVVTATASHLPVSLQQQQMRTINGDGYGCDLGKVCSNFHWHEVALLRIPQGLPEAVATAFNDLFEVAANSKHAAAACRCILDLISKEQLKLDEADRSNLFDRLEKMQQNNIITKPLCELAHHVRDQGNAALHEGTRPSAKQVEEAIALVTMIAEQVYELPHRIKEQRADA